MKRKERPEADEAARRSKALKQMASLESSSKSPGLAGGEKESWNSIDSDEEEEYERRRRHVDAIDDEDVEGEEQATIARDDDIVITPFNLKAELEEGVFAKDGNFVWNKKNDEEIRDSWLDNIDWQQVESRSEAIKQREMDVDEQEEARAKEYDESECYSRMLQLMMPGESVTRALRRLGKTNNKQAKKMTTAERWKQKRLEREGKVEKQTESVDEKEMEMNKTKLMQLTELADTILSRSGHMEVYEETYEGIAFKLGKRRTQIDDDVDKEEALDKFMETAKANEQSKEAIKNSDVKGHKHQLNISDEVKWEYRFEEDNADVVHGPHTTEEMLEMQEKETFGNKSYLVRKVGDPSWRDGKRIDFDLYT